MTTVKLTEKENYITDIALDDLKLVEAEYSEEEQVAGMGSRRKLPLEDNIGAFFKEMARYPLLTAEEEIVLANDVKLLLQVEKARQKLIEERQEQ
ncbi:MAG: RNA polymerase sigma factor, RpoD/SigA family, partial [Hydrococcus sp. SU_1_0]|nr:RNA polymerase sigma factor, RpoD/SigA family [Hydrococcus sp. SU_1_0]